MIQMQEIQETAGSAFSAPYTLNLSSQPQLGNLCIAWAAERSGNTAWAIDGSGWLPAVLRYQSPADATFRKSLGVWWKIAGDSEFGSITFTNPSGGATAFGFVELANNGGTWPLALASVAVAGYDAAAASYSSGLTGAVASVEKLLWAIAYTKASTTTERPYSDWSTGTDAVVASVELDMGTNAVDVSTAYAVSTRSGANEVTAAKLTADTNAERGAITALLMFTPTVTAPTVTWVNGNTTDWDTTTGSTRTITYTGVAGDRLLVVAAFGNDTGNFAATPVTNDGAALTWTEQEFHDPNSAGAQPAQGMWSATLDSNRTITITVTRATGSDNFGAGMFVAAAGTSDGFGASEKASNGTGSGAPTLTIATTQPNSAICALNNDWNATAGARTYRTADAGAAVENHYDGQAGSTYIVEAFHHPNAGLAGSKVVGLSAPSTQRYALMAVEVLGKSSGGGVPPPTPDEATKNTSAMRAMTSMMPGGRS